MFRLQPIHLVVVLTVALIIFGPKRLPQLGRWIGRTFSEFRKGAREMADTIKDESTRAPAETQRPPDAAAMPTASSEQAAPGAGASTGPAGPAAGASASPVESPHPRMAGNFCSQCGVANAADARFCNKCGTKLPV
jgi:sec-independent protein translocase protein TatA